MLRGQEGALEDEAPGRLRMGNSKRQEPRRGRRPGSVLRDRPRQSGPEPGEEQALGLSFLPFGLPAAPRLGIKCVPQNRPSLGGPLPDGNTLALRATTQLIQP